MSPLYTCGIDVAKKTVRYHLADPTGRCLASGLAPTNHQGLQKLLAALALVTPPAAATVVLEATGLFHIHWAQALSSRGYRVYVLNPLLAKRIHTVANAIRDNKTDKLDAAALASLGAAHAAALTDYLYHSEPARFALQRLAAVHAQLRDQLINLRKAYATMLDVVFPELGQLLEGRIHNKGVRQLLRQAPTPAAWLLQPPAAVSKACGTLAEPLLAAARTTLASPALAAATAPALQALLEAVAALEKQLRTLQGQMQTQVAQVASPAQVALVKSVGYGPKTAAIVVAFLPRVFWQPATSRRRTQAKLLAYMGAEPRVQESGQWKGKARMSKRGCEPLRTANFQACFCQIQRDAEFAHIYRKHRALGKAHKVAVSHLINHQVQRLVSVIQTGQPYQPKTTTHAPKS